MPETYIHPPVETEPDALAQIAYDYLQNKIPGWLPSDGQLDTWLIAALARQVAELRDVASDVPRSIFRYFGANLMSIPPLDAVSASVLTTWTMVDNAGHTIPAGTAVGVRNEAGVLQVFQTIVDVVIPSASTTATNVTVLALVPGTEASGLGSNGTAMELITSLEFVSTVVQQATTSGGQDAETDDAYLNRLTADLSLQAPRPILPNDFAIFARNTPGVARALAIDGYDAVAMTSGNARTITVAVVDTTGEPVSAPTKAAVLASLQAAREVNFLVYVIDPTYTTIDVNVTAVAYPGYATADVAARIQSAIAAYLSPANWGQPPSVESPQWIQSTVVKTNDLIGVAYMQEGVKDITAVTQRVGAGAFAATDTTLTGAAPLTRPGVITPTVT